MIELGLIKQNWVYVGLWVDILDVVTKFELVCVLKVLGLLGFFLSIVLAQQLRFIEVMQIVHRRRKVGTAVEIVVI